MKIKLDENLPERLVAVLTWLGHDVDTIYAERLNGRVDADVWNGTQTAQRFFITQDLDFSDMPALRAGHSRWPALGAPGATRPQCVARTRVPDVRD